jgi:hypothetical protein
VLALLVVRLRGVGVRLVVLLLGVGICLFLPLTDKNNSFKPFETV